LRNPWLIDIRRVIGHGIPHQPEMRLNPLATVIPAQRQNAVIFPILPIPKPLKRAALFAAGLLILVSTASRGNADPAPFDRILIGMKEQGAQFDPEELLAMGENGTARLLDFLMPESAGFSVLTDEEIQRMIGDLDHEQFSRRSDAVAGLTSGGVYLHEHLRPATVSPDPETASNALKVLRNITGASGKTDRTANAKRTKEYGHAYGRYLEKLVHDPCWQLIALRTTQALCAGRGSTGSTDDFMWQSFQAIARRKNDEAMSLFHPLIKFGDVSSSEWVFTHFRVFSPKDFTPSILKEIVRTDHVYNEAHLRRRLKHLRENGPDVPYEAHPDEVRRAFEELDATWDKTKTFLSYEKAALGLLLALPEERRRFEVKTPEGTCSGTIKRADYQKKTLTVETATEGDKDIAWKDITLLKLLSE